jgi:hypothetical protein
MSIQYNDDLVNTIATSACAASTGCAGIGFGEGALLQPKDALVRHRLF